MVSSVHSISTISALFVSEVCDSQLANANLCSLAVQADPAIIRDRCKGNFLFRHLRTKRPRLSPLRFLSQIIVGERQHGGCVSLIKEYTIHKKMNSK